MAFDRNDQVDIDALWIEVSTDPLTLGYDQGITQDGILDIINLTRATITVSKQKISASDVRGATTKSAYDGLLADEQGWLEWQTGTNGFGEENLTVTADMRLQLTGETGGGASNSSIWSVPTRAAMEAAMLALLDVDGSRAEQLFGIGTDIQRADWFAARDNHT